MRAMFEHRPNLIAFRSFVLAGCLAILAGCSGTGNASGDKTADSAPVPPSGLSASAGNKKVTLSWTADGNATGYNIKRSATSGGAYTLLASATSPGYTDSSTTNGATYYYVVVALDAAGESGDSKEVSATPQAPTVAAAAPTNLQATAGNEQASLTWSASSG